MRRLATSLGTLALALALGAPAHAEPPEEEPWEAPEWLARPWNNLKAGTNGLLTCAADPVLTVWEPPEAFDGMAGYPVTARMLGLPTGVVMAGFRGTMGAFDVAMSPLLIFPTMSPEARVELIEAEYE